VTKYTSKDCFYFLKKIASSKKLGIHAVEIFMIVKLRLNDPNFKFDILYLNFLKIKWNLYNPISNKQW